jgi:hypothetical protein
LRVRRVGGVPEVLDIAAVVADCVSRLAAAVPAAFTVGFAVLFALGFDVGFGVPFCVPFGADFCEALGAVPACAPVRATGCPAPPCLSLRVRNGSLASRVRCVTGGRSAGMRTPRPERACEVVPPALHAHFDHVTRKLVVAAAQHRHLFGCRHATAMGRKPFSEHVGHVDEFGRLADGAVMLGAMPNMGCRPKQLRMRITYVDPAEPLAVVLVDEMTARKPIVHSPRTHPRGQHRASRGLHLGHRAA